MHWALRAASRADCTAGSKSEMRTAMIAITTSNVPVELGCRAGSFGPATGNDNAASEHDHDPGEASPVKDSAIKAHQHIYSFKKICPYKRTPYTEAADCQIWPHCTREMVP